MCPEPAPWALLALALALAVVPALPARGAEVGFSVGLEGLASDNLDRLPPGLERRAGLWTASGGLTADGTFTGGTFRLEGMAGEEWRTGREDEEAGRTVHRLLLDAGFKVAPATTLRVAGESSRRTEAAPAGGLDRTRALTDRLLGSVAIGSRDPDGGGWEMKGEAVAEDRPGQEQRGTRWSALARIVPGKRGEWRATLEHDRNHDRQTEARSQRSSATLGWSRKETPLFTWGGELSWTGARSRSAGTLPESASDRQGARLVADGSFSPTASWRAGGGAEGLSAENQRRRWHGTADLSLDWALSPGWRWAVSAAQRDVLVDQNLSATTWSREQTTGSSLVGRLSRTFELTLRGSWSRDRFQPGAAGAPPGGSRLDTASLGALELAWTPSPQSRCTLGVSTEEIESNLPAYDLQENRVQLTTRLTF